MFQKIIATAVIALSASAANANLISNGDFESGTFSSWAKTGNVAVSGPIPGMGAFYFGGGSIEQNGEALVAFNGGDTVPNGALSQEFATSAGTEYLVMFDFGTTRGDSQNLLATVFGADGKSQLASTTALGTNLNIDLQTFTFSFIANGSSTTLQFSDLNTNSTVSLDGLLDNVSVSAVPEPASAALMGLGLFGFAASRRKSAKNKNV